jgi:hypothetical protein
VPFPASRDAHWIADTIQGYMTMWQGVLRKNDVLPLAREVSELTDAEYLALEGKLDRFAPEGKRRLKNMGADLRPYLLWEKHRQTYEPHPAMTAELVKLKADVTIPAGVFHRLIHPNPWFLFTDDAPTVIHADGRQGRLMGAIVTGALSPRYRNDGSRGIPADMPQGGAILMDTHDEDANALHALVFSEVWTEDGTAIEQYDMCHLTIPTVGTFTLEELVDQVVDSGFAWTADLKAKAPQDRQRAYLKTCARAAVAHLLYASSRTVEIETKPRAIRPPVKRKPGEPKMPKSPRVMRMGWVTGTAIADRTRRPAAGHPASGTGKSRRPHIRGAHLHLYRVGPGRQEVELKWLDPIPVNAGKDDGRTITNHPMH